MDVEKVRIIFIIPTRCSDETECSEDMTRAYEACRQNGMCLNWLKEQNYASIDLKKTDFVVFEKFEGEYFDAIKETKCTRIVGPWCLLSRLIQGRPIPNLPWPIFNVAMSDCFITCSNLTKTVKQEIKYKIQCMGGQYSDSLLTGNTHLITDTVKSKKYMIAAEAGLKIMLKSWVDNVWADSSKRNVHCNDEEFQSERCLPFHRLTICCTGLASEERKRLEKSVISNGGTFKGELHIGTTDILVCREGISSEKIKAARKVNHIKCVTIDWINDSLEKGFALPEHLYPVKIGTSTPIKFGEAVDPNFSTMSAIANSTNISVIQETMNVTNIQSETMPRKRKSSSMEELSELVDKIDLKRAKTSGSFLDGCSIYLVGFGIEQREKICKILNFSGATRYDNFTDRITHVIVGDPSCHELKLIRSKNYQIYFVTVKWLTDSMEQQQPVPEENYIVDTSTSPGQIGSPLAKKGLQFLRTNTSAMEEGSITFVEPKPIDIENDILQQYLRPSQTTQEDTLAQLLKNNESNFNKLTNTGSNKLTKNESSQPPQNLTKDNTKCSVDESCEEATQSNLIFQGLKFLISNFNEEEHDDLGEWIESVGGEIVPKLYKGVPDYAVVPSFGSELINTATEVVTDYYVTDCVQEKVILDILYYHRPFSIQETSPLQGCVVTISSYVGNERVFLINLIQRLGGISQEQLCRVARNDVLRTTHLLSPEAVSKKYIAALKWGLPVVNKDWLLECARTGSYVSEKEYLVGDSKVSGRLENTVTENIRAQCSGIENKSNISTPTNKQNSNCTISKAASAITTDVAEHYSLLENNKSEITPRKSTCFSTSSNQEHTPLNRIMRNSPEVCSQITPVNEIMHEVRMNHNLGTPPTTPPMRKKWNDVATPDTPYGAFIRPNPSPHLRKEMLKWIKRIPDHNPRRNSTPMSELKKRLWDKICPSNDSQSVEHKVSQPNFGDMDVESEASMSTPKKLEEETPEEVIINKKLLHLQEMLSSSGGNSNKSVKKRQSTIPVEAAAIEFKDSQTGTVGWDYMECDNNKQENEAKQRKPLFMISGADAEEREELVSHLENLGACVSDLTYYDPASTHLICVKPSRNEKLLSSMAAGKWILHVSYVEKSVAAGRLLEEEEFEYGNSKSYENIKLPSDKDSIGRIEAIHWWRKEVDRRGYGAFHDMRAMVFASRRDPIIRVIEAGGGMVIDISPPFSETVYATHCFLDPKSITDMSLYVPLAKQGIYCVNTIYINNFLHRSVSDIRDCVIPYFNKYYEQE